MGLEILGSEEEKKQFPWEYYLLRSDKFSREAIADVIEAAMGEKFDIGHIADRLVQHIGAGAVMTNKSNSHRARYAVVSHIHISNPYQIAWFVAIADAKDFIKALNGDPNYYSIEEVD